MDKIAIPNRGGFSKMRFFRFLALAFISLLALAGCGGSSGNTSPTATSAQPAVPTLPPAVDLTGSTQVTVKIIDSSSNPAGYWFDQPNITIKVGTTVTWVNRSSAVHTITSGQAGAADGKFDSGTQNLLMPNNQGAASTFSFTFTKAGAYPYFCQIHPGMIGLVTVTA
jgi:plastocyanin